MCLRVVPASSTSDEACSDFRTWNFCQLSALADFSFVEDLRDSEKSVQIFTRTRISESFSTKNGFSIEYTGAGPNNMGQIECNYLVDDRQWTYSPPGAKYHNISVEPSLRPNFGSFHPMHGGTALTSDCTGIPTTITAYNRYEGLTEVWQKNPEWIPKHGWIESISCQLPVLEKNRTIDAQIHAGRLTANHLNEVN